jgi:magnesium-transporting ATPase (P-type)
MSKKNSSQNPSSKISTFVLLTVYVVLALSLVAILLAINAFVVGSQVVAAYLAIIGVLGMAMSGYMLMQSRKRTMRLKIETPPTMTVVECKKCNTKTVREFKRGDFVFKELEPCQKCPDDKMLITAIYKEVKEKEKVYPF